MELHLLTLLLLAIANHVIVFGFIMIYKSKKVRRIYNIEASQDQLHDELQNSWLTSPLHAALIAAAYYGGILVEYPETWFNFK